MGLFDFFKKQSIDEGVEEYRATPGAILLDVRTRKEHRDGHIPGSKNVPLDSIEKVAGLAPDKNTPLFVYCQSGGRSGQAASILKRAGYVNVKNIGGFGAYTGKVKK